MPARVPYLDADDLSPENRDLLERPIWLTRALVNSPDTARAFHDRIEIIINASRFQTEILGAVHQVENFRGSQHRLCRDAAPIQADAPHMLPLDNCSFQAELGRANSGDIAPGPCTDDDKII